MTTVMAEPLPEYLTTQAAAQRLQVSTQTVRRWLKDGHLKGTRLSDRAGYRIPREEIERVLRDGFSEDPL